MDAQRSSAPSHKRTSIHPTRPDTVDQTGNPRTGFGQERGPQGNLKVMSYGSAYQAFYDWGMIERDPATAAMAVRLNDGQQVENAQREAAAPTGRS